MTQTTLQKNIMRRVYYAYAQMLVIHPTTFQIVLLAIAAWWLKELVFVARVWEAFVTTPIGELGGFLMKVLIHADSLSLLAAGITLTLIVSITRNLTRTQPTLQVA